MKGKEAAKDFSNALQQLACTRSLWEVFNDFLDFSLIMLRWWDRQEEHFTELKRKYANAKAFTLLTEAFFSMLAVADDDGTGYKDPFGDYFMEHLSSNRKGQFFTPESLCAFQAAAMDLDDQPAGTSICDPTCGSGRLLLAIAKRNPHLTFYGSDIDLTCTKMTVINMLINTMPGEVAHLDAMRMQHYKSWHLFKVMDGQGNYVAYYTESGPGQSGFIQRLNNTLSAAQADQPPAENPGPATTGHPAAFRKTKQQLNPLNSLTRENI